MFTVLMECNIHVFHDSKVSYLTLLLLFYGTFDIIICSIYHLQHIKMHNKRTTDCLTADFSNSIQNKFKNHRYFRAMKKWMKCIDSSHAPWYVKWFDLRRVFSQIGHSISLRQLLVHVQQRSALVQLGLVSDQHWFDVFIIDTFVPENT